jgi:multicomponent Na+:H+ antiporter subunit E
MRLAVDTVKGGCLLAWDVITPQDLSAPRIIDYGLLARTDAEIAILACMVSVTPGTLSLEVSPDRRRLHIHALYAHDPAAVAADIRARYERPLLALARGVDESALP